MKRVLSIGLLAVCALAITEQSADAWINSKFSIGLNWHLQSGNNNVLWGLWRNGQVPGPDAYFGGPFQYGPPAMSAPGMSQPAGVFPWFGYAPQQTAPPPLGQQHAYGPQPGYNPYQAVSYQPNPYQPSYFYPTYQAYQAPYYWYQGR
jgi:hypothetical protein